MEDTTSHKACENCNEDITSNSKFCNVCGQSVVSKRRSFSTLLSSFFSDFLSIDKKTFRSFRIIFIPGKLTEEYFSGRHGRYVSPWRIFVVAIIITILMFRSSDNGIIQFELTDKYENNFNKDSIATNDKLCDDENAIISLVDQLESNKKHLVNDDLRILIDSTQNVLENLIGDMFMDSIEFINNVKISNYDSKKLTVDQISQQYSIVYDTLSKYEIIEGKMYYSLVSNKTNGKDLTDFIFKNINWFIIFLLPFVSILFLGLYYKRDHFLIEHFIFNLHNHSAVLILISLFSFINISDVKVEMIFIFFFIFLYYTIAIKRYYKQSWLATILKFILLVIAYFFILGFSIMIFLILGALST